MAMLRSDPWTYYASSYFNLTWVAKSFEKLGGLRIFNCWQEVIRDAYYNGKFVLTIELRVDSFMQEQIH